jgi:hypothetical protein
MRASTVVVASQAQEHHQPEVEPILCNCSASAVYREDVGGFEGQRCSKCWDLQDSDQQPIRRHEGANLAKKPCEQSRCKTLPCPMLTKA